MGRLLREAPPQGEQVVGRHNGHRQGGQQQEQGQGGRRPLRKGAVAQGGHQHAVDRRHVAAHPQAAGQGLALRLPPGQTGQVGEQLEVEVEGHADDEGVHQEELPGEGLPGEEHGQPVQKLRRSQQDAEGLEQGQVPHLVGQIADGVEDEQVAHPVGQHVQPAQVDVQQDEQVAPGDIPQGLADEGVVFRHGRTSVG